MSSIKRKILLSVCAVSLSLGLKGLTSLEDYNAIAQFEKVTEILRNHYEEELQTSRRKKTSKSRSGVCLSQDLEVHIDYAVSWKHIERRLRTESSQDLLIDCLILQEELEAIQAEYRVYKKDSYIARALQALDESIEELELLQPEESDIDQEEIFDGEIGLGGGGDDYFDNREEDNLEVDSEPESEEQNEEQPVETVETNSQPVQEKQVAQPKQSTGWFSRGLGLVSSLVSNLSGSNKREVAYQDSYGEKRDSIQFARRCKKQAFCNEHIQMLRAPENNAQDNVDRLVAAYREQNNEQQILETIRTTFDAEFLKAVHMKLYNYFRAIREDVTVLEHMNRKDNEAIRFLTNSIDRNERNMYWVVKLLNFVASNLENLENVQPLSDKIDACRSRYTTPAHLETYLKFSKSSRKLENLLRRRDAFFKNEKSSVKKK